MKKQEICSFPNKGKGKKLFLVMKLAILMLMVGIVQVSGNDALPDENNPNKTVASADLSADQQRVTGKIVDTNGEAIPGATIIEKGTTNGTVSDMDGNFSIMLQGSSPVLSISFVGMISQEIPVGNQTQINVTLEADYIGIEEVVAVGYGTMKKSDLTGSVTSVTPEKLVDRPVFNIGQALENKASGVQVIKMQAGRPGSGAQIRIRGTNSINTNSDPLFVVDGIVGVNNALDNLNPNDIESMDILKDASATAIYGTRGANGVIIITTKRGQAGEVQVNYDGSVTLSTMLRHNYTVTSDQLMYQYAQAIINTPKYGSLNTSKDFRGGKGTGLSWSEMTHLFEQVPMGGYLPGLDFMGNDGKYYKPRFYSDWEEIAFNPAWSNDHHVQVTGGSEAAKMSLSVGRSEHNGLMLNSYLRRTNVATTSDFKLSKWLSLTTNINYSMTRQSTEDDQLRTVSETWPILPTKYPDDPDIYGVYAGLYATGSDWPIGENWRNIEYVNEERNGYELSAQFTGGAILNAQITPDLSFKTDISVDNRNRSMRYYNGDYQGKSTADARGENRRWFYWQSQNYFNYNKTIGDHTIAGLLGLSWSESTYDRVYARARNFASNFYQWNNLGAGSNTPQVASNNVRSALNSYFARFNYSYLGKYMLTATGRIDGSSKFGKNNKYAFFPSVGAAWRASEEGFLAGAESLSNLKLRASIGQTGNQEIGSYVTQQYVSITNVWLDGWNSGLYPGSTGNPNLKWETTTQYDIGVDLGLFENRIIAVVDAYYKKTTDMLFSLPLPGSTAPGNATVNYGSVENKGLELELTTRNIDKKDFTWTSTFTWTMNKNKILELGPTNADVYVDTGAGNATSVYRVGEPIGSFFGLTRDGVWSTQEAVEAARYGRLPGDLKFTDTDNDGKIDLILDGDIIGKAYPDGYGGFNNTFTYKNFDASINFQYVYGVNKAIVHESAEDRQFVSGMVNRTLNAWRPDHQTGTMIAQVRAGNAGARYDSKSDTHQMYNGDFLRGQTAQLGYTFKANTLGLSRLRVYFAAENFLLICAKMEGYDPEGSSMDKQRSNVPNIDKYQYPNPTNYSFGVNVNF